MQPTPRSRLTFLVLVFALLLMASAAFGAAGGRLQKVTGDQSDTTCVEPTEDPVVDETTDDCATEVEGEEGDTDSDPTEGDGEVSDPTAEERATACAGAAGLEPDAEGEDGGGEGEPIEVEKLKGLDNAIAHVLENCLKNPDAPGPLNALEHLAANAERHEAHELWKAERAGEREAAKAERRAAHDAAKAAPDVAKAAAGHGNPHSV